MIKKIVLSRTILFDETAENEVSKTIPVNLQVNDNFNEFENIEVNVIAGSAQLEGSNLQRRMFQDSMTEIGELSFASTTLMKLKSQSDVYAKCISASKRYGKAIVDEAWKRTMNAEIEMIENNQIQELVNRPTDKPIITQMALYKSTHLNQLSMSILRSLK